jgi:WD40 repeat protein
MNLAWHPTFDYILASASSDSLVRVWDIKNNGHKILDYHKSRVRCVQWNYELPWLLISGGDDSSLAAWDIRTNTLIAESLEPCISFSSMTSHPSTPFSLITSHLDNSLIIWDLLGLPDVQMSILSMLVGEDILSDVQDLMKVSTKAKVSGDGSKSLTSRINTMKGRGEKFCEILRFFNRQDGDSEFENMVYIMAGMGPKQQQESSSSRVYHI